MQALLLLLSFFFLPFTSAVQIHLLPPFDPVATPNPSGQQRNRPYQGPNPVLANLAGIGPLFPGPMGAGYYEICSDHPPGVCCQGRLLPFGNPDQVPFRNYRVAQFWGLMPQDEAAVYQPRGGVNWQPGVQYNGCSGRPVDTKFGPGDWQHPEQGTSNVILSGASYLRLPPRVPGDEAAWVEKEGVLGMVTASSTWTAKGAGSLAQRLIAQAEASLKGGGSNLPKRDIRSREKGTVVAKPPRVSVWADVIVLNGTYYKEESVGSPIYKSQAGDILNFTSRAT
ncbi:MAG: hypothetical protein Q9223_000135 [Gallowayella weberi]